MVALLSLLACQPSIPAGPAPPAEVRGCDGALRLETPADPAESGPWPVGARTVEIGRLTVEIWYPAVPGSEAGLAPVDYDIRYALPESQQALISDEEAPSHVGACYRGLPLDDRGPFPLVVFVHGTAAWRSQSLSLATLWASRGFVVASADHPGLWLADALSFACGEPVGGEADMAGDVDAILEALATPSGELAFLGGALDLDRIGITGHSAGGTTAAQVANRPGVRAVIPMASATAQAWSGSMRSSLFLGGLSDGVVPFDATRAAFEASSEPKRLVGLDRAGHLAFSDICGIENDDGEDILTIAVQAGVCGAELAGLLFDCDPSLLDGQTATRLVGHATVATLETELACIDRSETWDDLAEDADVAVLEEG